MTPEYPVSIPEGSRHVRIRCAIPHTMECAMLRSGMRCNNETDSGALIPSKDNTLEMVPVCDMCISDMGLAGPDQTAYWRDQQREWGVR